MRGATRARPSTLYAHRIHSTRMRYRITYLGQMPTAVLASSTVLQYGTVAIVQ